MSDLDSQDSIWLTAEQMETIRTDGMVVAHIRPDMRSVIVFQLPGRLGTPYGRAVGLTEQEIAGLAPNGAFVNEVPLYQSTALTDDTVSIVRTENPW